MSMLYCCFSGLSVPDYMDIKLQVLITAIALGLRGKDPLQIHCNKYISDAQNLRFEDKTSDNSRFDGINLRKNIKLFGC